MSIGEAITITGQASDRHIEMSLNAYMNKVLKTDDEDYVIAGDTDSVYLNVDPIVKMKFPNGGELDDVVSFLDTMNKSAFQKVVNKSVRHIFDMTNAFEFLMDMKREAIASKAIWTAKKRYAMMVHDSEGVKYHPAKLKIMGMDIIKSSTPLTVRKELKAALPIIFEDGEVALRNFVAEVRSRFFGLPVEKISFPRGTSNIDKWVIGKTYKSGTPIHVRGAILYNNHTDSIKKYDKIRNGDKIKFCYLKMPNPINENVISFPSGLTIPDELGLIKYVDYDKMFETTFLKPLEGITVAIGFKLEVQSTLESFFS